MVFRVLFRKMSDMDDRLLVVQDDFECAHYTVTSAGVLTLWQTWQDWNAGAGTSPDVPLRSFPPGWWFNIEQAPSRLVP